jgi:hypothetical protein
MRAERRVTIPIEAIADLGLARVLGVGLLLVDRCL